MSYEVTKHSVCINGVVLLLKRLSGLRLHKNNNRIAAI